MRRCGALKVPLINGLCGCPADYESVAGGSVFPVARDGGDFSAPICRRCSSGKHKPEIGNSLCKDKPIEVWPFIVGAGALVLSFLIYYFTERRSRRREL